jgi:hypothetical protein
MEGGPRRSSILSRDIVCFMRDVASGLLNQDTRGQLRDSRQTVLKLALEVWIRPKYVLTALA